MGTFIKDIIKEDLRYMMTQIPLHSGNNVYKVDDGFLYEYGTDNIIWNIPPWIKCYDGEVFQISMELVQTATCKKH